MNDMNSNLHDEASRAGLLNVLMYLDMEDINRFKNKMTVNKIIKELGDYYADDSCLATFKDKYGEKFKYDDKKLDAEFFDRRRKYEILVNALENDPEFGELLMDNHVSQLPKGSTSYDLGGLCACTFEDDEGNVIFAYRGTGSGEWIDNGQGISGLDLDDDQDIIDLTTQQQDEAAAYFDEVFADNYKEGDYNITITGHSKGGNKAQFVTLAALYRSHIDNCYSFDGQGMSLEAIEEYIKVYGHISYDEALRKMYGFSGDNDYVNRLGTVIIPEDQQDFFETVYDIPFWHKFLDDQSHLVKYWHYPDAYFNVNGTMSEPTEQGVVSENIDGLVTFVNGLEPEDRIHVANVIMASFQGGNLTIDGVEFTDVDKQESLDHIKAMVLEAIENYKDEKISELTEYIEGGITQLQQEIEQGIDAFEAGWEDFKEETQEFIEDSAEAIEEGWNDFQEEASEAWEDFQDGALETWDGVCNFFNPYVEEANEFINDSVETVSDGIDDLQEGFENGLEYIENGWSDFQNGAGEVWADVQDGASEAWDDLQEGAGNAWDDLQENASNAWDSIWNQFNPEPEKVDDDIDDVKDSSSSGSSFLSNIDIAAMASSLQQSISDAWNTLQAKLEEVETVGIYPGMPYNSQYTNIGSFTSSRRGGSGSEVDLYMLTQLRNNLRNLEQSFERSIADILRESNRVIRDTDSDYREYYVQQDIQRIYSTHSKLERKARILGEKLERKREALDFALEHYQKVEKDIVGSLAH